MSDNDAVPDHAVVHDEAAVSTGDREPWILFHVDDLDDPRLADFRNLNDAQYRRGLERNEFFVAEGPVPVERLLGSGHRVRAVLVAQQKYERLMSVWSPPFGSTPIPVFIADKEVVNAVVGFDLHRGVVASAERLPHPSIAGLAARSRRLVVLEGLNDPENLGLIARSARALGADGMLLDPTCTDPYSRRSVRVSMGEILYLPTARATGPDWPNTTLSILRDAGFSSWAMTPSIDAVNVWSLAVPERVAVMFGAEGPGLSPPAMARADHRVSIPIASDVDSLNVAASAAVALAIIARPDRPPHEI